MRECHRRVSFLIAEKSMRRRMIGFLARMVHASTFIRNNYVIQTWYLSICYVAVPVVRPQDIATTGKGRITLLNPKTNPTRVTGINSAFLSQVRPGDSLVLPRKLGKLVVAKVISDTELEIKSEVKDEKTLKVLTAPEGSAYKCLPHVDQDAVYERVYDELNNGECITIFPEGGSHDRAEMLPLKGKVAQTLLPSPLFENGDTRINSPCSWCHHHGTRCYGKISWPRCENRPLR